MSYKRHRRAASAVEQSQLGQILARQPHLPYKYLRRNYLAANLTRDHRAEILAHHYAFAASRLSPDILEDMADTGTVVWRAAGMARTHDIRLLLADPVDNEGEFTFEYRWDARSVGLLSFSFGPAPLFGLVGDTVPLVSRIQTAHDAALLREVARDHHDIAPRFALAAAMEGLALGLRMNRVVAVSLTNQVAFQADPGAFSPASYDTFYEALGGHRGQPGFFDLAVPFPPKEPEASSSAHGRRSRRKRAVRQTIAASTALVIEAGHAPGPLGVVSTGVLAGETGPLARRHVIEMGRRLSHLHP